MLFAEYVLMDFKVAFRAFYWSSLCLAHFVAATEAFKVFSPQSSTNEQELSYDGATSCYFSTGGVVIADRAEHLSARWRLHGVELISG